MKELLITNLAKLRANKLKLQAIIDNGRETESSVRIIETIDDGIAWHTKRIGEL